MVLNIITGTRFPQFKLYYYTNKFFNSKRPTNIISSKKNNYIIKIGKHSVEIVLSTKYEKNDLTKIKNYIQELFDNHSILIKSSENLSWLSGIENVTINTFDKINR